MDVSSHLKAAAAVGRRCVQGRLGVLGKIFLWVLLLDDAGKIFFYCAERLFIPLVSVYVDGSPATFAVLDNVLVTCSHPPFHHSLLCFLNLHKQSRTWFNACVCSWGSKAQPGSALRDQNQDLL